MHKIKTPGILLLSAFAAFLLALDTSSVHAQDRGYLAKHVSPVRSIDPADTDFQDLKGLAAAIGDARLVLLGEQTHGEGSTFLAKTRIIKFLHEKMGFEVLAFESGIYDVARIWENVKKGRQVSKEVIGSLFYMYATSRQMQPLFEYIQSGANQGHPLIMAGFESQHSGVKAKTDLFVDFEEYLKSRHPGKQKELTGEDWELFKRVSVATFTSNGYRPAADEKKVFFRKLQELKEQLSKDVLSQGNRTQGNRIENNPAGNSATLHLTELPGFWYEIVCSIESQATRYWQMVKGNEVSVRDLQMAKNLEWLAEKAYPGKKIIAWAHNVHISKGLESLLPDRDTGRDAAPTSQAPPSPEDLFVPMGSSIHRFFGAAAYCIGFSGAAGSYMNYENSQILSVPARSPGSIEGILAGKELPYAFIDYRAIPAGTAKKQAGALADYGEGNGRWGEVFDGLFFIDKVFPVDRLAQ